MNFGPHNHKLVVGKRLPVLLKVPRAVCFVDYFVDLAVDFDLRRSELLLGRALRFVAGRKAKEEQ